MTIPAHSAKRYRVGVESTKGTAVTPTTDVTWPDVTFTETGERTRTGESNGSITGRRDAGNLTGRGTGITINAHPLTLEELYIPFGSGIVGGVTPTQISASGTYQSVYTWPRATVPTFDSLTVQRILTDGTNQLGLETSYVFCSSFTLEAARGGNVTITSQMIGRKADTDATISGSTALQTTRTKMEARRGIVGIASSLADLTARTGTYATISNQILTMRHTCNTGLEPVFTKDGRSTFDYSFARVNGDSRGSTTELSCLLDSDTTKFAYKYGITDSESNTPVWFELLYEGAVAAGGENFLLSVIGHGLVDLPAISDRNEQGMSATSLTFNSVPDTSTTTFGIYSYQSTVSALPS